MPYCSTTQANFYYEKFGDGTPIVFIHGFSIDHQVMSGCMEPIMSRKAGWSRIYIDLPGMGKTKGYKGIRNSDAILDAVLEFIDILLPNQSFAIVGESYGAYIARGVIEQRAEQVVGAAFICPLIFPEMKDRKVEAHQIMKKDSLFLESLSLEELQSFQSNNVILTAETWNRYNNEILSGIQLADLDFLAKIRDSYGFTTPIDQVVFTKPSVFLLGKQDSSVGYKDALSFIDNYPRSSYALVDMAGHNLQFEQPEIFKLFIEDWLGRVLEEMPVVANHSFDQ